VPLAANRRRERSISQRWLHVSYHLIGCIAAPEVAKGGVSGFQLPVSGECLTNKKRPELFSSGRLGSPPPELPNHEMHTRATACCCKRHFGNSRAVPIQIGMPR